MCIRDSADSVNYEQITYEGYGPSGVAIIVDTLTDNKNRTASNVRNAFTKGNGNVGTPGCVSYMFEKKGQIIISKEECEMDADDLMMMALDAGAEDFNEEDDSFEVLTTPEAVSYTHLDVYKRQPLLLIFLQMIFNSVVLPVPFGPIRATRSSRKISALNPWNNDLFPNDLDTSFKVRTSFPLMRCV